MLAGKEDGGREASSARHLLPVALLLVSMTGLMLAPLWPADRTFGFRDLLVYFLPMREFAHRAFLSGFIPYRNPFISCGNPFLANPEAQLFYPPAWGYLLFGLHYGGLVYYASHLLIGAFGAAFLAIRLGGTRVAGGLSGLIFGFSGFAFSLFEVQNVLSDRFIPWIIFAAIGVARKPSWRRWALLVMLESLMIFGGEPSLAIATHLVVLFLLCRKRRFLAAVAVSVALPIAAAAQFLPTVRYVAASERVAGFASDTIGKWSLAPSELLELMTPGVFRAPYTQKLFSGQTYLASCYLGVLAVALLVCAGRGLFGCRRNRLLGLFALFALAVSMGAHTPLFGLYRLATFGVVRYPVRFFTFVSLAVALLSGFAFTTWRRAVSRRPLIILLVLYPALHLLLARLAPACRDAALANGLRGTLLLLLLLLAVSLRRSILPAAVLVLVAADYTVALSRPDLYTLSVADLRSDRCLAPWLPDLARGTYRYYSTLDPSQVIQGVLTLPPEEQPAFVRRYPYALSGLFCGMASAASEPVLPVASYSRWLNPSRGLLTRAAVRVLLVPASGPPGTAAPIIIQGRPRFSLATEVRPDPGGEQRQRLLDELSPRVALVSGITGSRRCGDGEILSHLERGNSIEVAVDAEEATFLVISDLFDEAFHASLDEEPVPLSRVDGVFMGAEIPAGQHRLLLSYQPLATRLAIAVSVLAWLFLVGALVRRPSDACEARDRAS